MHPVAMYQITSLSEASSTIQSLFISHQALLLRMQQLVMYNVKRARSRIKYTVRTHDATFLSALRVSYIPPSCTMLRLNQLNPTVTL